MAEDDFHDLERRLAKLEWSAEETQKRLNNGASAFSEIEKQIEDVNAKISPKWTSVGTVALIVMGWVWVAARYPGPEKFEKLQDQVQQMQLQQAEVNADLGGMHKSLDEIEKRNARIESKLDTLLKTP